MSDLSDDRQDGRSFRQDSLELTEDVLAAPFEEWPIEIRESLEQYAPGGLSVALVPEVSEDN